MMPSVTFEQVAKFHILEFLKGGNTKEQAARLVRKGEIL